MLQYVTAETLTQQKRGISGHRVFTLIQEWGKIEMNQI